MNKKFKLGIFIFTLGFIGVLSTLTMEIPLPEDIKKSISELFTPWQFKLISLINPIVLLSIFVLIGTLLYDKVNFKLPIIESLINKSETVEIKSLLKYGIIGGIISGGLITLTAIVFQPYLPTEFIEIGEKFKPSIIARFLYGGLTEEILVRYGLMSLLVWLIFKIFGKLNHAVYWVGIIVSAIVFGFGHFPFVYMLIETPTIELLSYILLGNIVAGIVFGWLYWKKGLETAMIGHVFTHIIMLISENIWGI